jgi:hypothetical protein
VERELPQRIKFLKLSEDPNCVKANTDKLLPSFTSPNKLTVDPSLVNERSDSADPRVKQSKVDSPDPNLAIPKTEREDPNREKVLQLMLLPKLI